MTHAVITLDNPVTGVKEFEQLLQPRNKVLLVVLGNTVERRKLVGDAVEHTEAGPGLYSYRYPVLVTIPELLYPKLQELPIEKGLMLPPAFTGASMYGVSIATDNTICNVITGVSDADIALAFLLAETH